MLNQPEQAQNVLQQQKKYERWLSYEEENRKVY